MAKRKSAGGRIFKYLILLIMGVVAGSYYYSDHVYPIYVRYYYRIRNIDSNHFIQKEEVRYQHGEYAKLRHELERYLMAFPDDAEVKKLYGRTLIRLGEVDQGMVYLVSGLNKSESDPAKLNDLAIAMYSSGYYLDLVKLLDRYNLALSRELLFYYGAASWKCDQKRKGEKALLKSYQLGFRTPDLLILLSDIYVAAHRKREAIVFMEEAYVLSGERNDIARRLLDLYLANGENIKARNLMGKTGRNN